MAVTPAQKRQRERIIQEAIASLLFRRQFPTAQAVLHECHLRGLSLSPTIIARSEKNSTAWARDSVIFLTQIQLDCWHSGWSSPGFCPEAAEEWLQKQSKQPRTPAQRQWARAS